MWPQLEKADEWLDSKGSKYPDLSYEEGVARTLSWVLGLDKTPPMDWEE
jgi:hypothetical protein